MVMNLQMKTASSSNHNYINLNHFKKQSTSFNKKKLRPKTVTPALKFKNQYHIPAPKIVKKPLKLKDSTTSKSPTIYKNNFYLSNYLANSSHFGNFAHKPKALTKTINTRSRRIFDLDSKDNKYSLIKDQMKTMTTDLKTLMTQEKNIQKTAFFKNKKTTTTTK